MISRRLYFMLYPPFLDGWGRGGGGLCKVRLASGSALALRSCLSSDRLGRSPCPLETGGGGRCCFTRGYSIIPSRSCLAFFASFRRVTALAGFPWNSYSISLRNDIVN